MASISNNQAGPYDSLRDECNLGMYDLNDDQLGSRLKA